MEQKFKYEDTVAGHMQEFIVRESSKSFTVEVPGIAPQEAADGQPAVAGTPTRQWAFPKEALARVFPHGREDLPALCDFIQAAWPFSRLPDALPPSIHPRSEEQVKLTAVCKKFAISLLGALDVTTYAQFRELSLAVDASTTMGSIRAAERNAEKEAKAAAAKAKRDAKGAEKKAEREKAKAEKKAAKDKAKAEAKEAKAKEKAEKKEAEKKAAEAARIAKVEADKAKAGEAKAETKPKGKLNKSERQAKLGTNKAEEQAELARVAAEDKARREAHEESERQAAAAFERAARTE